VSDLAPTSSTSTIQPISELFRSDAVALWATTYNLDLALFNEYLLGRLGDPPLNAVVLADRDRLDASLAAVPPERVDVLNPVNRRWLLRGVRIGGGRFHPKSYLSVTARAARLLVGSGNLSTNGIDRGREVFTAFSGGTPHGHAAIGTWRAWLRRVVDAVDDTLLADRFADLEERLPKPAAPIAVVDSPLWHNFDRPLVDQFCDHVLGRDGRIDELLVTAPYYDEGGEALGRLVDRLAPDVLRIYLAGSTNVDGAKLADRLAATGVRVETFIYRPDRFTHAKLLAAVVGRSGWVLSGSANLSHAALTLAAGVGNVELAVIAELDADRVRASFLPPDVNAEQRSIASLADLTFDPGTGDEPPSPPVRVTRATLVDGGRVRISTDPAPDLSWLLADHENAQPLVVDATGATTAGLLAGPLVRLVDTERTTLSNHVVVEDPDALHRVLQVGERSGTGRPAELTAADLNTPLGRALEYLHRNVVMDVSEGGGRGGGGDVTRDESGDAEDDDLWNRLEREKLGRDPRAGTYNRLLGQRVGSHGVAEPLVELLEAMRDRAPSATAPQAAGSLLQLIAHERGTESRWSTTAKIRVRARNVLRRWAAAQTDPRLSWVDPYAPLGNLGLVAAMFADLWCHNAVPDAVIELTADDLDELWGFWFQPFVGTCRGDGWLDHVDLADERIRAQLNGDLGRNVTVLCWLAIRPGRDRRHRIVAWQPYLRAALDKGLICTDADTAEFLAATAHTVDAVQVETDILEALDFIDDNMWCEQQAAALGLEALTLEATSAGQAVSVRLKVRGIEHPLYDPRVPTLVIAVRQYRSTDAVALVDPDRDWRIVVSSGDPVAFLADVDAPLLESNAVDADTIERIAVGHGVLADLFPANVRVA
jgi:hypothetical protein